MVISVRSRFFCLDSLVQIKFVIGVHDLIDVSQ